MGGGGGGGGQARASARQAEAQARTARLQSSIYESNAAFMADTLSFNLRSFDEQAGQALGSTALQLARSGNLSRAPRAMSNADQLGLDNEVPDPLDTLREQMGDKSNALAQFEAMSQDINELRASGQTLSSEISDIDSQIENVDLTEDQVDKLMRRRGELTEQAKQNNSLIQETIEKRDQLGVDDPGGLRAEVENLQTQIDSIEEVINEVSAEAPEGIERQQALTFTAGSTHTQASKALQSLLVQRDKMFMGGISGVLQMTQNAMVADEQAEMSEQAARDYMDLADDMDFNAMLSTVFQGLGLAAGVGLSIATAGAATPVALGTGMALGGATGSFLGNAFAR